MKRSINIGLSLDWKSLVIGILMGMLVLFAAGSQRSVNVRQRAAGRYVPVQAGNSPDAIFIVDAYTGHTWRLDESSTKDYGVPVRQAQESENENK